MVGYIFISFQPLYTISRNQNSGRLRLEYRLQVASDCKRLPAKAGTPTPLAQERASTTCSPSPSRGEGPGVGEGLYLVFYPFPQLGSIRSRTPHPQPFSPGGRRESDHTHEIPNHEPLNSTTRQLDRIVGVPPLGGQRLQPLAG